MEIRRGVAALLARGATSAMILVAMSLQASAYDPEVVVNVGIPLINVGSRKCFEPTPPQQSGDMNLPGLPIQQRLCTASRIQDYSFRFIGIVKFPKDSSWYEVWEWGCYGCIGNFIYADQYLIYNGSNALCMAPADGATSDWSVVQQLTCDETDTSMFWYSQPGDFYGAIKLRNVKSHLCLDVRGGSSEEFAQLQQYHCTSNNEAQNFRQASSPNWPAWERVAGSLKYVSVGEDGTVWGVNDDDEIYRWNNGGWDQIAGSLKQISVGNAGNVWGVNSDDEIYRRSGNSWTQVPGALKQVSVASDSTVWGVNDDDEIYQWNGGSWDQVAGSLKQISVGNAGNVWGVNSDDEIYRRSGNSWTQVPGVLKQVSVASDGTVWGVNDDDEIYRWNVSANAWKQIDGALKQISLGAPALVWGVNANDQIFTRLFAE